MQAGGAQQAAAAGSGAELRDFETIRAYLEELARRQTRVRLWLAGAEEQAFETTLQKVTPTTFTITTTPQLQSGQTLQFAFMLDARRFTARSQVVNPGVFRMPQAVATAERRGAFRGGFAPSEQVQVLAVERVAGTFLGGRLVLGRLGDLSVQGLGLAVEEVTGLDQPPAPLQAGTRFDLVRIGNLPFTPDIQCAATVVHAAAGGTQLGLRLEGLSERDLKNIERLLIPRFPATFGEAFPTLRRRTDLADQQGPPTSTQVQAKAPEVLDQVLAAPAPAPAPARPQASAVVRLRRAARKILFLSARPDTPALLEAFRQDGFRQAAQASGYQQAKLLAEQTRFELVVADLKVGSHRAKDLLRALGEHGLLQGQPLILMVDQAQEGASAMARPLEAAFVHERGRGADALMEAACVLLGVD